METTWLIYISLYFWANAFITGASMERNSKFGKKHFIKTSVPQIFFGLPIVLFMVFWVHLIYSPYRWIVNTYDPKFYLDFYLYGTYDVIETKEYDWYKGLYDASRKRKDKQNRNWSKRLKLILDNAEVVETKIEEDDELKSKQAIQEAT